MKSIAVRNRLSLFEQPLLSLLAWLTVPVPVALLFGEQVENAYQKPYFLGFGMAIAAVVALILALNSRSLSASIRARLPLQFRFTNLLGALGFAWIPTLLAVFMTATMRWLVVAGGVADELFTGLIFELLLLYCVVGARTSRANRLPWAAFAGLFAGLLAYEYDSYKIVLALPPAFWLAAAGTAREPACRRRVLQAGGL